MSIYHSISDYINAKERWKCAGTIIDGIGYFLVRGSLIPDQEYLAHNSKPVYQPMPRENSDGQNIAPDTIIKQKHKRLKP
jgi:predicted homoserine dehydrogenase-like protein